MNTLEIKDIGPIHRLNITLPPGGGVTVLRGSNGCGKSTALRAIDAHIRGEGKLETRDDAPGSGSVSGLGATLHIGRKTNRAGEIEVVGLESKLNIADLVDPHLIDPGAADRTRIKALIGLTGTKLTVEQFTQVIGEEATSYINPSTWAKKDPIEVAAHAKRDLEAAARSKENEASIANGEANSLIDSSNSVDTNAPHDEQPLRQAHTEASGNLRVLQERLRASQQSSQAADNARKRLRELTESYAGPTVEQASAKATTASEEAQSAQESVNELQRLLTDAQADLRQKKTELDAANAELRGAIEHGNTVAECEKIINTTSVAPPDETELEQAREAVNTTSAAVEQGALIRKALADRRKGELRRAEAQEATALAEQLRLAAAQIDDVLSRAVNTPTLLVRDGRLYTNVFRRGHTGDELSVFHELSCGQKWRLAFGIVADVAKSILGEGERAIIAIPAEAWAALQPRVKSEVAAIARELHIEVVTEEPDDGELRAEEFEGGGE